MINLVLFSIMVRETSFLLIRTEVSTLITMLISITIMLKINNNLSAHNLTSLFSSIESSEKVLPEKKVMTIFYLVTEYLNQLIQSRLSSKQMRVDNTIDIFVEFLKKEHERECAVVECFCKNSKVYRNK